MERINPNPGAAVTLMSDSYTKKKSCTGRLFGTLFAFIAAAAVVYAGSYVVLFHMTGLPAADESKWLGPKLRFLATGPYEDTETGSIYRGDTKPYEVFKPLNTLWLQTRDVPTTVPVAAPKEDEGSGRQGGEGRRGRGGRRGGNDRLDEGTTTTGSEEMRGGRWGTGETTGTASGEPGEDRPRRRGGRRSADGGTTGSLGEGQSIEQTDGAQEDRPRRRGGRPGQNTPE